VFEVAGLAHRASAYHLDHTLVQRPIREATELVAGVAERCAEATDIGARVSHAPPLGQTHGQLLQVVEWLIEWRDEAHDFGADALFERVLAASQRLIEGRGIQSGQPLVPERMAGDLVAGVVNAADL